MLNITELYFFSTLLQWRFGYHVNYIHLLVRLNTNFSFTIEIGSQIITNISVCVIYGAFVDVHEHLHDICTKGYVDVILYRFIAGNLFFEQNVWVSAEIEKLYKKCCHHRWSVHAQIWCTLSNISTVPGCWFQNISGYRDSMSPIACYNCLYIYLSMYENLQMVSDTRSSIPWPSWRGEASPPKGDRAAPSPATYRPAPR